MLRLLHPQLELEYTTFVFVDPLGSDDPNTSNNSATITLEECELARGRIGRVFKGLLRYETLDDPQPLSVILKLVAPLASLVYPHSGYRRLLYPAIQRKNDAPDVLLADLAHEARLYASPSALASLQGTVVPRCYGYARNSSANAACLILEDAGKALTFPYRRLPIEDRWVKAASNISPMFCVSRWVILCLLLDENSWLLGEYCTSTRSTFIAWACRMAISRGEISSRAQMESD